MTTPRYYYSLDEFYKKSDRQEKKLQKHSYVAFKFAVDCKFSVNMKTFHTATL